jgi:hypothetical protein
MALQLFKIASATVGSGGATSFDFTSIPQGYTDLMIKVSVRGATTGTNDGFMIRFNNDTTTSYSSKYLATDAVNPQSGSNAYSSTGYTYVTSITTGNYTANSFSNVDVCIPNYTNSNYKSFSADGVSEKNASDNWMSLVSGLYPITTAISRITLLTTSGSGYSQYSTATLYGIL